ncbi:MAG: alpha/beta fold hydrolase [Pseudomonadales bacterium]|nr:alpha/beta fold hydrolase [Pseudomonadales bacterium]MCP5183053.1 alpha/beta fold hydrolase [Pseudomonadales bacterium]
MAALDLQAHDLTVRGVRLRIYDSGAPATPAPQAPVLLFLHGLRDVAHSLLPVAAPFADRHRLVLPDQRGHGASDRSDAYAMEHFIHDLYRVIEDHVQEPVVIIGHSLGGQIASRFAAVFGELVRGLVLVEGLGPPALPDTGNEAQWLAGYRQRLLSRFADDAPPRDLGTVEAAAGRLKRNNPRLADTAALAIARQATRRDTDGRLVWAFDPHAASVFVRADVGEGERFWRQVQCPTLVISGDLAHEYWLGQFGQRPDFDGRYAPGEMDARAALFPRGEHCPFHHSGHMVHYDEPERLVTVIREFLHHRLGVTP